MKASSRWISLATLALVLVLGGALRFYRLNWDDNQHIHPDERYITWVATTIRWPAHPNTWEGWQVAFDARRSSLNPFYWPPQPNPSDVESPQDQARSFAYGHLPLYVLVGAAHGLEAITPSLSINWLGYDSLALVGRALSALFDVGTILMTFLLGRRVWGPTVGLFAAALIAFTPLHIQLAHFYATDTLLTFFVAAALWQTASYVQDKRPYHLIAAGACAGLAIGSKFTAVWLLPVLAAPLALDVWPALQGRRFAAAAPLILMLTMAFVAFALTNPFALIELPTFVQEIAGQGAMVRGGADWPYTRQYHNTLPFIYPLSQLLRFGAGPAFSLAGWIGLMWGLRRAWQQTLRLDEMLVVLWTASYFALTGGLYVKFVRYMLPIVPPLAILAAAVLSRLLALPRFPRIAGGLLVAVTLITTILNGLAFAHVYDGQHPWLTASRWIYDNAPAGAFIVGEYWDDRLPLDLDAALTRDRYRLVEVQPYEEPDSPEKLAGMLEGLAGSNYVVFPTHRLWGTIPRWPERYPLTTRYYQALFDGRLGYRLEFFAARYPRLGPITLMDQPFSDSTLTIPLPLRDFKPSPWVIELGRADESFTVYDHPLTLIFRNVERLTPEQMQQRLLAGPPDDRACALQFPASQP